jgi:hypothetical protein
MWGESRTAQAPRTRHDLRLEGEQHLRGFQWSDQVEDIGQVDLHEPDQEGS